MKHLFLLLMLTVIVLAGCQKKTFKADHQLAYCTKKIIAQSGEQRDFKKFPRNIEHGQKLWKTKSAHDWTSGFYPGILWNVYQLTNNSAVKEMAEGYTKAQKVVLQRPVRNHDLGFMIFNSHKPAYDLTGDDYYRQQILVAADSLATLFNPKVGTICSWPYIKDKGWPHNTIIDNMLNLEMLFWAADNGGNPALRDMAVKHAQTSAKYLIRPDFTTYHVSVYDTITGDFMKGVTHQGYADDSMWARGQAWGIYGFTMCYRETKRNEFLETAKKLADVFIENLPEDGIPYWDFNAPDIPNAPKDASAAAVAASGMLELSQLVKNNDLSSKYFEQAKKILMLLSTDHYLSNDKDVSFIQHSTGHKPKESEVDVPIVYGDYYYLEALMRLSKLSNH
ncbi:glucuronyl hydrolase [Puteibacter caeruleilacunae]|nr:glucuronyl hydrolase [Puteibacter caeruleilacunae]